MQQDSLFSCDIQQQAHVAGSVTCLGKNFANEQERRDYFLGLLAEKLKDPEFRKIEGFPIGSDADILNLSDPPYYTTCPNPWIGDFVAEWEAQKIHSDEEYHREPFAADVSEGKNDPIYNAHSYHTKVPHKAIMRYILHYTNPGDIVFDGFCGTGMTGVAAQMCADKDTVISLGYQVDQNGVVLKEEINEDGQVFWRPFSKIGARKAILNDISPAASFIAGNYNTPTEHKTFEEEANRILRSVESEYGWMYETKHDDGQIGKINFTLWSEVFVCSHCNGELIFWDVAIDKESGSVKDSFKCSHCSADLTKRKLERSWESKPDKAMSSIVKQPKKKPVLINYSVNGKRFEKIPDAEDLRLISKIDDLNARDWHPTNPIPDGDKTGEPIRIGMTHVHHMYTHRNLLSISSFNKKIFERLHVCRQLGLWFTSSQVWGTKQNRLLTSNYFKKRGGVIGQTLQGTLYISSLSIETNIIERFRLRVSSVPYTVGARTSVTETGSATNRHSGSENSIDYVFIDPPFGSNLMYSELNVLWESWLKVRTDVREEAIENKTQQKGPEEYRNLMVKGFSEVYRLLKPGRWMTVEFSNTNAGIWNGIQTAITGAGFIIANVSALQKTHNGFNAVTNPTSVKQDLVISAYKPTIDFGEIKNCEGNNFDGVWGFVREHLKYLSIAKLQGGALLSIPERDPRIIYDQLVSFYVRKGYALPINSKEFQLGLRQRFHERDGMFFLPEQVAEYDRKKIASGLPIQISLFVKDESSAIEWIHQQLKNKPQTFSDINPHFMQQLGGWSKNEIILDLRELLSQNFLCYDGQDEVPDQIHSYLSSNWKELRNLAKNDPALVAKAKDRWYVPDPNKAGDLEKLREKSLLKEFEEYKAVKKKLKVFRIEAVRVGFKKLWEQQDFAALIAVAEKLPNNVLEEDPVLLMYYDQAVTLSQVDADDEW